MKRPAIKYRRYWLPLGWPTGLILFVIVLLWMMWPRGNYAPSPRRRLPEPGAAYVQMEGDMGPLYQRPMLFALPSRIGFGARSPGILPDSLPGAPKTFVPRFLPRDELVPPGPEPGELSGWNDSSAFRFSLAESGSRDAGVDLASETGGVRVVYSPSLLRSGFRVDLPATEVSNVFWGLTFHLLPLDGADPGLRIFVETRGSPSTEVFRQWLASMHAALASQPRAHGIVRVETVVRSISGVDKQDRFAP